MSIARTIHYCWFGYKPKPELANRCIASWKKYCPDYEIIEWNETNFNISECPKYVQDAYHAGLWAFVSDYARLKIVYENGGIYLDTDVELLKPLDKLLKYEGYFGFEDHERIATGLGFGAVPKLELLQEMMEDYYALSFFRDDGSVNYITCPDVNTHVFLNHGLKLNNRKQILDGNILILPTGYLCPINYSTGLKVKTFCTISIHWFSQSWMTEESRIEHKRRCREVVRDYWIHLPNRILMSILGHERYEKLKKWLRR